MNNIFPNFNLKNYISNDQKYTINDILIAAIGGGIHRYNQLLKHKSGTCKHSIPMRLLSIVNTRSAKDVKNVPKLLNNYRTGVSGNKFSNFILTLNIGGSGSDNDDDDIRKNNTSLKIHQVHNMLNFIKRSPEGYLVDLNNRFLYLIGGCGFVRFLSEYLFNKVHSVISNLKTPEMQLYLADIPIKSLYNCTAPLTFGCSFHAISYNGEMILSTASDANVVPVPRLLLACIETEFSALYSEFLEDEPFEVPSILQEAATKEGLVCELHGMRSI